MPRTYQPVRSLDKCSEHDRVPGVPPTPGSLAAGLPPPQAGRTATLSCSIRRTKHPPKSDRVQYGAVDLWSAATTTQQSNTPNTPDLAYVGHCSVNPGDFGTMLKLHGSFGVIVMHRRNGLSIEQMTRLPLNPLPFLMIC